MKAAELCATLGVSRRTLTTYLAAGCPHERRGAGPRAPLVFDLAKVKGWIRSTARSGDVGRPPEGAEPLGRPSGRADEELDAADLAEEIRRVNLAIKELEKKKRERIEAEALGELVPYEDVKRAWGAQVEVVKTRLRSLPSLLSQRMEGMSYDERHDLLEREFRRVLESFAREELAL